MDAIVMDWEVAFRATFRQPDFELLRDAAGLAERLCAKLPGRTNAREMRLHQRGQFSEHSLMFPLSLISGVGTVRMDSIEVVSRPSGIGLPRDIDFAATLYDVLQAVHPDAPPKSYSDLRLTLAYTCVLPMEAKAKDLLDRYVAQPKFSFGEYGGAGVAFYFGRVGDPEHTSITLDRTSLENGLSLRVVASTDPRLLQTFEPLKTTGPERIANIFKQLTEQADLTFREYASS